MSGEHHLHKVILVLVPVAAEQVCHMHCLGGLAADAVDRGISPVSAAVSVINGSFTQP